MLRNVPLMGQYDAGRGIHLESQIAWGINAAQALHGCIEGNEETDEGGGEWYDYKETGRTIDISRGGMTLGHSYSSSMFTEGIKYYGHDGRLGGGRKEEEEEKEEEE